MKPSFLSTTIAASLGFALFSFNQPLFGQIVAPTMTTDQATTQSTTTTSAGTISEFSPDTIVVKSESSATPIHYTYSKSTTYLDESGNAVSMETVKSGLPVTVYYVKDGDNLVASKVVVRKAIVAPAATLEQSKTTTTTTEK